MKTRPVSVQAAAASAGRSECTDPLKLAAGVLIEYADLIEEGEVNRSGPLKGRCAPAIEEEVAEYRRLAAALTARSQAVSDNDKRWRFLEHGCQWVSWTPTGGDTVSFDPRNVKYLQAMRASADKTSLKQVALLRAEADALERRMKK